MEFGRGATRDAVRKAEEALGVSLPGDYVDFMVGTSGGEIEVGENQIRLWPIEELVYMNEGCEVDLNAPGLVMIPCGRTFTEFLNNLRRGDCFSADGDGRDQG